jgi:hypothetical protein
MGPATLVAALGVAAPAFAAPAVRVKVDIGTGDVTNIPIAWMFIATLLTFLIARLVTRYIRHHANRPRTEDEKAGRALVGDIKVGGVHIHHQVFGIFIMLLAGMIMLSAQPDDAALCVVAALFGVGVGLVFDEFALWLHLKDVYWADEGRHSVDAIFCVLSISGILIGGANLVTGSPGSAAWWTSVAYLVVILGICVICALKGKLITAVIGILLQPVAIVGAIRLAKPDSYWARHRYATRPKRRERSERRFGAAYTRRWNRVKDFIAGAPTVVGATLRELTSDGTAAESGTVTYTQLALPLEPETVES